MDSSMGAGLMVVFAVSGSVALFALHVHKRLLSDFMKKIEFELGSTEKGESPKKTVSFAVDVMEPSSNNKEYRKKHIMRKAATSVDSVHDHNNLCSSNNNMHMPLNRQVLYKGLIEYKSLIGCNVSTTC